MAIIAVIRLKGRFSMSPTMRGALESLRLSRLYSCTLIHESDSYRGMLQGCKDVVSFGAVEKETVDLLLRKRGRSSKGGKRLSADEAGKISQEIMAGKKLSETGVQPVFLLAPPKGGFGQRKEQNPFGPLGKNPNIARLISLMA